MAASVLGAATPALAQRAPDLEEVVVTGSRVSEATLAIGTDQPTATVSITSDALLSAPAGITGLKMLESLPGFNVQANDALGMYEFGNSVSVRAFNFQQIGFLLDNVPMGRSDQFGGSPIYRYVDNENLARVTASSGAGDVSLASYASLGPIVSYIGQDPSETAGGFASLTLGSDALKRGFLRLETGEHAGLAAFVSGSMIRGDLWRGPGYIDREHYEAKIRYRFGASELMFQTVHNQYFDYDSPAITLAQYRGTAGDIFRRRGRNFAYLGYVPLPGPAGSPATPEQLPITAAGIPYSNAAFNQYYKFAVNARRDHLYALTLNSALTETLRVTATGYYEDKGGYGVSPEAYATSLASHNAQRLVVPGLTAPRGLQYGLSVPNGIRKGVNARAEWRLGAHAISGGVWLEKDDYHRTQARYNVENGDPDGAPLLNEPVHLQRNYVSTRDTVQLFLKDTLSLLENRLSLDVGFKALNIDYQISGYRNPADYIARRQPVIAKTWKDSFLPQVGLVWSLTGWDQVFASYSENMALPRGADDVFSAASPNPPPPDAETAKNWEIGVRTNRPTFNASLVAYMTSFDNRLQSFASVVPGSTTTETFFQNVGSVEAHGGEFSGQWKPNVLGGKVYFKANASYNIAEFQDNFATFAIAGNRVPDFPKWLLQGGVTFEPTEGFILNLSARHISKRYTNFTNTETTAGYTVWSAYLDLGDGFMAGPFEGVKARVNVDNIFDEDYLGTISPTINTPATFRPGPRRTVQFSLSAAF
ncbi:TonB-dependent receptor domain-containing protein [Phenylobacterium sp.]|uniref:TonB-dependent receptor domain-containing protein n=1 Tax=Phenylobacterium sp. TaxID=1871053 RepID=UPI0035B05154